METLLTKTKMLNKAIQKSVDKPVDFDELVKNLSEITSSQTVLIGRKGKILSWHTIPGIDELIYQPKMSLKNNTIDEEENVWLLKTVESKTGVVVDKDQVLTIVPVYGGGERLGTLIFGKVGDSFTDEDLVLFEYSAMVVGLEILRLINERKEHKIREKEALKLAMEVLSYSEVEALKYIFNDVSGKEAFLVASTIAKKHRLTRSVIVNALRKLESAGVIDARSLGMKGTHVRIKNPYFLEEIQTV